MCAATHKDTHAMRRQTERRYEDQRERESRQDVQTLQKGMLGNPQRGKGRGGEGRLIECLHWLCDIPECETETLDRQTDSWGQTAALSLWPQQPTELKTRCCSSTNVHQRPPKCVSVKKSNFTAEISMSLCQKNRSTHLTAFKCLTWSILNKNLSFPGCRNRQITEKNKTQNGVPQGSITDPLLIIQIISSCLFASTNVQRVFFFKYATC